MWDVVWLDNRRARPVVFDPQFLQPFDTEVVGLNLAEAKHFPTMLIVSTESDEREGKTRETENEWEGLERGGEERKDRSKLHAIDLSPLK
eukprot:1354249-Amorphochlora_amoeboformis.AAC.1